MKVNSYMYMTPKMNLMKNNLAEYLFLSAWNQLKRLAGYKVWKVEFKSRIQDKLSDLTWKFLRDNQTHIHHNMGGRQKSVLDYLGEMSAISGGGGRPPTRPLCK